MKKVTMKKVEKKNTTNVFYQSKRTVLPKENTEI